MHYCTYAQNIELHKMSKQNFTLRFVKSNKYDSKSSSHIYTQNFTYNFILFYTWVWNIIFHCNRKT